uniref:NEFA-interacting nuclear protein NIP30 n=1 Tax=Podospora anserina (strain S / ATCC MYA-4624 / DSM 980 / FGSC 10383) TaxID=515849 RepID=A0A090CW73_PODAN|nr:Putative NEFA-interacting nuclear protein NIP30 [Podospora anserina S mat+]
MSSRFVSAGSIDATTGEATTEHAGPSDSQQQQPPPVSQKSKEWAEVTQQLESDRQRRILQAKQAQEGGEKSLYEVLQANKAAKQAEFEEKSKLKNQFRALDEDEIDFLDEVERRRREEEERRRREEEEGLRAFREIKSSREKGESEEEEVEVEGWDFGGEGGRRRKRRAEGRRLLVKKVKREEKMDDTEGSPTGKPGGGLVGGGSGGDKKATEVVVDKAAAAASVPKPAEAPAVSAKKAAGGLVDYGSDSDE